MVILIKCFKESIYVDKYNRRYRAKTTCLIKSTPQKERFFLTNGKEVGRNVCLERIK